MNTTSIFDARKLAPILAAMTLLVAVLIAGTDATAASKRKIVTLTPFSSNALVNSGVKPVAIGAQAVGRKAGSPKLKGIRQLTLSHPNGPNMEEIAKIDPDVVLTSSGWRKGSQTMRDLAITVREMDPTTVSKVVPQIKAIGRTYGSKRAADKYARKVQREITLATKGRKITKRPTVLLILGVGRSPNVFLRNTWGASVATAAGAKLLGGELEASGGFRKVSDEYIVAQDPDIIISVPHGNASDIPAIRDHYLNNPAWSSTKAVKSGNVHVLVDDALLQPDTDAGHTIKRLRKNFLKNW